MVFSKGHKPKNYNFHIREKYSQIIIERYLNGESCPQICKNFNTTQATIIYIPSEKVVIECDGDYWHGNPEKYPYQNLSIKQRLQIEKDMLRTKQLNEKGYKVLRLWENEIKTMRINKFREILNEK